MVQNKSEDEFSVDIPSPFTSSTLIKIIVFHEKLFLESYEGENDHSDTISKFGIKILSTFSRQQHLYQVNTLEIIEQESKY